MDLTKIKTYLESVGDDARKFKIDDTDGLHLVLSAGVKGVTLSKFNQFLVDQLDLEWLKSYYRRPLVLQMTYLLRFS
ncbi:MAG: hypothetical protein F6K47_37355 [Symploca sp. SIO2E6]|nr:hypothetical protein [Symploca sp. SIO2E6]